MVSEAIVTSTTDISLMCLWCLEKCIKPVVQRWGLKSGESSAKGITVST